MDRLPIELFSFFIAVYAFSVFQPVATGAILRCTCIAQKPSGGRDWNI